MKKTILGISAILVLLFTSCSKDEDNNDQNNTFGNLPGQNDPSGQNTQSGQNNSSGQNSQPQPKYLNGHEYVEIGGKKWATMNVGATTVANDPFTCYGDYFGAYESVPRYTSKKKSVLYDEWEFEGWKSYCELRGTINSYSERRCPAAYLDREEMFLWMQDPDFHHHKEVEKGDPAKSWGSTWRTPKHKDFVDLFNACGGGDQQIKSGTSSTTAKGIYWCENYNNISGILFSDGKNRLFFPAAGNINYTSLVDHYRKCDYRYIYDDNEQTLEGYVYSGVLDMGLLDNAFFNYSYWGESTEKGYSGATVRPVSD